MSTLRFAWLSLLCWFTFFVPPVSGQESALPQAAFDSSKAAAPGQLRVLSYNIHHGRGVDDQVDLERIAEVIRDCRPDLVALQEVDHRTRRTGGVDQTAQLGKLAGLHAQFARQIDFEGGQYGQALLSRWPLSDLRIHWLPGEPERERRIVATCRVDLPGKPLVFGTTHLHHANSDFRLRQARALSDFLGAEVASVIVAGDLNCEPDHPPIAELQEQWTVVHSASELQTFPAVEPTKQIDYVLYRPSQAWRIVSSQVINEPTASDHRPLLVVLEAIQ